MSTPIVIKSFEDYLQMYRTRFLGHTFTLRSMT